MPSNSFHTKCARTESCWCCWPWCSSGRAFYSIHITNMHFPCKIRAPSLSLSFHSTQLQNWKCPARVPHKRWQDKKLLLAFTSPCPCSTAPPDRAMSLPCQLKRTVAYSNSPQVQLPNWKCRAAVLTQKEAGQKAGPHLLLAAFQQKHQSWS